MASKLSDRWQTQALPLFAVREILDKPLEDETPQSRIKQIGMMNILYMMHQAHEKLTLSNIIEFTGMTRSGVLETMELLVKRGILTETLGKNSAGRGVARQFKLSPVVLEQLSAG
ncbi:transcriptional regulator [Brucella tritici]|uniref:Transcriptional regulator n=1 Tax=Brucella tritici TaxID=94626 RepID=A0A6L3Y6X9_9HYPH|nr:transcriptional regulator [Brucella tritici]KAB2676364.1 transcriptional regulator [Brucella tritici]